MPSNKTNKNGLLSPVVAGFNGGGPRVPGLRSCFWLPVASHRAGHTGARVPPWVLASFFGGGVIGNASLGDTVDFFGNAVMPATVGAAGAAVGHGEWHGGGLVDVVAVGGRSVSEKCPSLEARGGGGGVGPRRRLRTVRSSGVPGPRDFPVSGGRARLSGLWIQQIGAAGRVCGSEEVSPLAVGTTGVGFGHGGADVVRTSLEVRLSVLPSWGLRGARRNRSRILRAARRAACMRSVWPASLRCSCCRTLCRPFGGGGIR
jgi:hypothetical protein